MTAPRRSTRTKKEINDNTEITITYPKVILDPVNLKRKTLSKKNTSSTQRNKDNNKNNDIIDSEDEVPSETSDDNTDDNDFQPIKRTTRKKAKISVVKTEELEDKKNLLTTPVSSLPSTSDTLIPSLSFASSSTSSTVTTPTDTNNEYDSIISTDIKKNTRQRGTKRETRSSTSSAAAATPNKFSSKSESYPVIKKEEAPIITNKSKIKGKGKMVLKNTLNRKADEDDSDTSFNHDAESQSSDDTNDSDYSDSDHNQIRNTSSNNQDDENRRTVQNSPLPGGKVSWYKRVNLQLAHTHKELSTIWDDIKSMDETEIIPIEQPEHLKLPLLNFQKYGVAWMIRQEQIERFKGGILADEMGMGKTIQTISLILHDNKKLNLVIAPSVAIIQWKKEIETHTTKNIKVHIFHGTKRATTVKELQSYDVIITTYSIIESAFRKQEYGTKKPDDVVIKEKSLLHKIKWHRIILDEAHNIKDRSCNTARSVFNLKGNYKWSLTGTPLQNRVGELYSLIRFMQADPFAYYYCKICNCKNISWQFSNKRTCDHCDHTPMNHVCWWNNEVLKPIQFFGYVGEGREAMDKLSLLLDKIMLRRTKTQCADDLGLPPRTIVVRRDVFTEEEEDVYHSLYSDTSRKFNSYVEQDSVLNNYANIFELLTKMRQCVNHPDLVTKKKDSSDNKQLVCMLCSEPPEDAISSACKHTFCRECCVQYLQSFDGSGSSELPRCPSCFAIFSVDISQPSLEIDLGEKGSNPAFSKSSIINRINMDKWRSSTKIEALVEELSKTHREDRTIKSIVFSQFVSFLDLVYWRLSKAGFQCIRLDGTMTPQQRDAAIQYFTSEPKVTVFLISLKAGGVALNLTEASRVFICDPWWNPAAELQAMDRIHRLGQHRPIRITRLIIENSIESRIVQLQEKKTALVNSTIDKDLSAMDRLSVTDLKFLFVM